MNPKRRLITLNIGNIRVELLTAEVPKSGDEYILQEITNSAGLFEKRRTGFKKFFVRFRLPKNFFESYVPHTICSIGNPYPILSEESEQGRREFRGQMSTLCIHGDEIEADFYPTDVLFDPDTIFGAVPEQPVVSQDIMVEQVVEKAVAKIIERLSTWNR